MPQASASLLNEQLLAGLYMRGGQKTCRTASDYCIWSGIQLLTFQALIVPLIVFRVKRCGAFIVGAGPGYDPVDPTG